MKYDYVVIGAGVSGLTTAIILAKNGYRVALVEKSKRTAPLMKGFKRDGIFFDTGFHYLGGLGDGEIMDILFRYLGIAGRLTKEPFDQEGFDVFRLGKSGSEFRFPYGYERIQDRFHEVFPRKEDKWAVDHYFSAIKENCQKSPYLNLDADLSLLQSFRGVHGPSLKEVLDSLTDNDLLKYVLSLHCFLHGVPPTEVSFAQHACIVGPYYSCVHGLEGGGLSLTEAFNSELGRLDVEVHCGRRVSEILFSHQGAVAGVRLANGGVLECTGCVSTVHPQSLLDLVPASFFRASYVARLKSLEETFSAYIVYGDCRAPLEGRGRSNLVLSPGIGFPLFRENGPLQERLFFVSLPTERGERSPGRGVMVLCQASTAEAKRWCDAPRGVRPPDYLRFKEAVTEKIKKHFEAMCPEWAGRIVYMECATPLTLKEQANSPYGSLYGVKHRIEQYNPLPLTRLGNLFLAGQSIVAPGVLGAMISGFVACGSIIGHELLRKDLKRCL